MANTKKVNDEQITKTTKKATTKNVESKLVENKVDETEGLKKQLEDEKNQNKEMKAQLEQMQQMMLQMQQTLLMQQQNKVNNTMDMDNEKVKIVSYAWGRLSLCDSNGAVIVSFKDSYEPETISYRALQQLLTTYNKNNFFKKGLVGFVDDSEKYYEKEGIVKPFVLSKENLISLYTKDFPDCLKELDRVIAGDNRIKTAIFWQTIRMLAKNEITDSKAAMMIPNVLIQYFECKNYQSCIGQVNLLKDQNYID